MGDNRAARRRNERAATKAIKSRGGPPSAERPNSEHGVEVDLADDGFVYLTFYGGYSTFCVKWTKQDAETVAGMIQEAAAGKTEKGVEIVRESGIVVPPPGMQL